MKIKAPAEPRTAAPRAPHPFRQGLAADLEGLFARGRAELEASGGDILRVDLHCHDKNSDIPDETLGRLLRLPETWLETRDLVNCLRQNAVDAITITNHNNARSCWRLLEKGEDVLPAAEFSCTLPDFKVGVHVLTYGFTPAQEPKLASLRRNIYKFLEYTAEQDLPTVLAHPLHFYSPGAEPPLSLMDKFALLFSRFEVVNGQRDAWQNLLTASWVKSLTPEKLDGLAKRTGLPVDAFCRHPYRKAMAGGSDCHFGLFAGTSGTLVAVPAGAAAAGETRRSDLVLAALREGRMAPYGSYHEEEKLSVAFLDYFCQVALRMRDPGLLRLLMHRGTPAQKLSSLLIANGMMELRRHKYTSRFLEVFHESLHGRSPGLFTSLFASRAFKPVLRKVESIARARRQDPAGLAENLKGILPEIYRDLNQILVGRVEKRLREAGPSVLGRKPLEFLVQRFELPCHLRTLFGGEASPPYEPSVLRSASGAASRYALHGSSPGPALGAAAGAPDAGSDPAADITALDLGKLSDGLPFPLLASGIIAGAAFAGSRVLYDRRPFLDAFSRQVGAYRHPRRALWLTDTLEDKNGVAHVLKDTLEEVRRRDLPIDFLVCSSTLEEGAAGGAANGVASPGPGGHLRVLRPLAEFALPQYEGQPFRIPDLLELQKVFAQGGYDRIICSTEGVMGLLGLYLKHAFTVPAHFYVHTDWIDFARRTLAFDDRKLDRLRRLLRTFYQSFDGLFVLNAEQRDWFRSPAMNIPAQKVKATAHWVGAEFRPKPVEREAIFPGLSLKDKVMLFVGRVSEEKGVLELPEIHRRAAEKVPGLKLVVAGTGPAEARLRSLAPEALFLGWVDHARLPDLYSAADLLVLPSRFDTFGCVVLEALSCGLPVVAYNTKGPRDLIRQGLDGFLAEDLGGFAADAARILGEEGLQGAMRLSALERASHFEAAEILGRFLSDIGLAEAEALGPGRAEDVIPHNPDADHKAASAEEGDFLDQLMEMVGV